MRVIFLIYSIVGWVALALLLAYWLIVERAWLKRGPAEASLPPPQPPPSKGSETSKPESP